jgi:hypothetical protein
VNASVRKAWKAIGRLPDVELGANVYGDDDAYWVDAHQMVNAAGDEDLAIRLTR